MTLHLVFCRLHYDAAAATLLGSVRVFALVNLRGVLAVALGVNTVVMMHTVPHRDGTIQSLGSLSVNAIRLRATLVYGLEDASARNGGHTLVRLRTRVSCGGRGPREGAG
jgi:energy-converting hydrogenase Eha subunit B